MAVNPIRKEDIIDVQGVTEALLGVVAIIRLDLVKSLDELKNRATEVKTSMAGLNAATKEGQTQIAESANEVKRLSEEQKQLLKLQKDLEKATAQYNVVTSKEGKLLIEQINKTKELTKEQSKQTKEVDYAADSYEALNKQLNDLIKQYKKTSAAQRGELTPEIQRLDKELKKLDAGIGRHQRNVGNYRDVIGGLPGPLGQAATGVKNLGNAFKALLLNPVALAITAVIAAVAGLFAAFKSADSGATRLAARFEQLKSIIDVIRQRVITFTEAVGHIFKGEWKEAGEDFKNSVSGAGEQLREATRAAYDYAYAIDTIEDAQNNYISRSAEVRNEIAKLEYSAQDRSKTFAERKKALQDAIALGESELAAQREFARKRLEAEITYLAGKNNLAEQEVLAFIKMTDAEQENADEAVKTARNNNEKKFNELESFYAAWIDLDTKFYEENKRNLSRMTGFEEQARKERETAQEAELKRSEERVKAYWDNQTKIAEKATEDNKAAGLNLLNIAEQGAQSLAQIDQDRVASAEEVERKITEINEKYSWQRIEQAKQEASQALDAAMQVTDILMMMSETRKNKELEAAGDNEKKREEIEKKYFNQQKKISIAQALINGAQAITKVQAQTGVLSPLVIPLIVATTLAQIGLIASQTYAKGGYTGRGRHRDKTGERVAGVVHEEEFVLNKRTTKKYRPLIEAIHKDDPRAIAAAVTNRAMHQVHEKTAEVIMRQDPFTEKMYKLMEKTPTIYTDTNGNTVKEYPDGRKRIIKRA